MMIGGDNIDVETASPSRVMFVGPFPPPLHGQSLVTKHLHDSLVRSGIAVRKIDTGEAGNGLRGKLRRALRLVGCFFTLLAPADHAYISVNAKSGLLFTAAFALAARVTGKKITLHHHVYRYIAQYDLFMEFLALVAGKAALHLANCDAMAAELAARYSSIGNAEGYGNAGFVDPRLHAIADRIKDKGPIILGHMSNLSIDKGVGRAIDLLRQGRLLGLNLQLLVAGPFAEDAARRVVEDAQIKFPDSFQYIGPVFGDAKIIFFSEIDLFVFPTRYANEAGPIVNLEAMAAAVPVISIAQCCIPSTLANGGGIAVGQNDDFNAKSIEFIRDFAANRKACAASARRRYNSLAIEQVECEQALINRFRTKGRVA